MQRHKTIRLLKTETLILRLSSKDGKAYDGFQWSNSGTVSAPDFKPTAECGNGLHGWLKGEGDASSSAFIDDPEALWIVAAVKTDSIIDLKGKVKFPKCMVVYSGNQKDATNLIKKHHPEASAIIGYTATAGDDGTATAGNYGTATAGHRGTATAGHRGTATAGDYGTATAGDYGTATAGGCGTATAGNDGTATAGNDGTATAGVCGTATAGHRGTATADEHGTIMIKYYDKKADRYRTAIGYIGEDGLLPNVKYKLVDKKFQSV
jgi:hypothetical protein